ncbi:hypothetical protein ACHAPU_005351 [Fusarium lateritium]
MDLSPEELGDWFLKLQEVGKVHNINIVTPEHVVPQVALSILHARDHGLAVPIVYNTSSFDSLASLQLMDVLVDIYLADFKEMGIAKKGLLIRHLVMPGKEAEGAEIMKFLAKEVSSDCFVNIMEQYHPDAHVGKPKRARSNGKQEKDEIRYAELNRPVTNQEVSSIREAAQEAGLWRFNDPPGHDGFAI